MGKYSQICKEKEDEEVEEEGELEGEEGGGGGGGREVEDTENQVERGKTKKACLKRLCVITPFLGCVCRLDYYCCNTRQQEKSEFKSE